MVNFKDNSIQQNIVRNPVFSKQDKPRGMAAVVDRGYSGMPNAGVLIIIVLNRALNLGKVDH